MRVLEQQLVAQSASPAGHQSNSSTDAVRAAERSCRERSRRGATGQSVNGKEDGDGYRLRVILKMLQEMCNRNKPLRSSSIV